MPHSRKSFVERILWQGQFIGEPVCGNRVPSSSAQPLFSNKGQFLPFFSRYCVSARQDQEKHFVWQTSCLTSCRKSSFLISWISLPEPRRIKRKISLIASSIKGNNDINIYLRIHLLICHIISELRINLCAHRHHRHHILGSLYFNKDLICDHCRSNPRIHQDHKQKQQQQKRAILQNLVDYDEAAFLSWSILYKQIQLATLIAEINNLTAALV